MAGSKNASKSSKAVASSGQQSLLHFYKKKSRPSDDVSIPATEVSNVEATPLDPSEVPEPNSLPQTTGTVPPSRSVKPDTRQGETSNESVSGAPSTNLLDEPLVPLTTQILTVDWSDTIEDEPNDIVSKELPQQQLPSYSRSDSLRVPIITERGKSIHKVDARVKPQPPEPFPIFKHRLPPPTSPPPASGKGKRPPNQPASSSRSIPLELQPKPAHLQDVVDLTASSPDDEQNQFVHDLTTERGSSVIVIDDEPNLRGTQDAPIDLGSSPPSKTLQTKVIHPFFARRAAKQKEDDGSATIPASISASLQMQIPWPDADMQHNRGPQSCFWSSAPSPFPLYRGSTPPPWFSSQPSLRFLENDSATQHLFSEGRTRVPASHVSTPVERDEIVSGIPNSHREHSAISRLLDMEPPSTAENGEAWTHKWRPRSAAEVLGNEDNAHYMKQWLQALEIRAGQTGREKAATGNFAAQTPFGDRGTKRPNILRAVEKKRGRKRRRVESSDDGSSLGDWIVQEEEEEEEEITSQGTSEDFPPHNSSSVNEGDPVSPSNRQHVEKAGDTKPPSPRVGYRPAEFAHLTNTILLVGPSGSGKTSTVYACAEELGWEVFEVYPGIGRRSGANISSLVGDVGKNHIVGRRGTSGSSVKNASTERSFIKTGFGFLAGDHEIDAGREDRSRAVRQSIILFEEVDVLFKEDSNFWPAVVNVIKSSHRPVFLTCNDISLVPLDDLPLQATLHFQTCPAPLAISFLQSVCLAEGQVIPRQQLESMYLATYELISSDQPDEPQIPYPSQPQVCSDLRRVLNELQFWYQRDNNAEEPHAVTSLIAVDSSPEVLADWSNSPQSLDGRFPEKGRSQRHGIYRMWKHSDYASYVDGYLGRRPSDVLEALAIDRYGSSPDDEIGHALLEKPRTDDYSTSLSFYNRDEAMAQEALVTSRHVFEASGAGPHVRGCLLGNERGATLESRSLLRDRAANQTQVVSYLDDVIPLSAPLLPRPPAVLEYAAYMRQMVSADDAMERAASADGARAQAMRGRWRIGVHRYLTLSRPGLEGARATQLGDVVGETPSHDM